MRCFSCAACAGAEHASRAERNGTDRHCGGIQCATAIRRSVRECAVSAEALARRALLRCEPVRCGTQDMSAIRSIRDSGPCRAGGSTWLTAPSSRRSRSQRHCWRDSTRPKTLPFGLSFVRSSVVASSIDQHSPLSRFARAHARAGLRTHVHAHPLTHARAPMHANTRQTATTIRRALL